jgi:hypothetical protein
MLMGRASFNSLTHLHPEIKQIYLLWKAFLDNFNPLAKIIHAPSGFEMITSSIQHLELLGANIEALMFSIYLAAIVTLGEEECLQVMGQEKAILWVKYSYATQQALIKANFLKCSDIVTLQALTLYLVRIIHTLLMYIFPNDTDPE